MAKEKPISLNPLKFDDAIRALLGTTVDPSSNKPVTKKQPKSKPSSKSAS